MRVLNLYILFITIAAAVVNILLAALGQDDITVYFVINLIVYLIISLLFINFNPKARRALSAISVVLFAGFMVVVVIKALDVLLK